ncbi:MAG: transcriptional regulator [Rhodobacteraceae bacterium]|nr:transcriptional regulator [Paracoccaceae bacterium]MAY47422.1 transcriptional regulator [Paracoccaceae bacterium]QEW19541.1 Transcriptional regulator KdgR [Marinibacterium anthonyi]
MSGFESVRSLHRGLQILQVINQRNGLKAGEIAKQTGIPRPTVYRLVETLESMRFISRDHSTDKWRVTLYAKSLSSGFRDEDWVLRNAVPEMVRLGREILWPIDLVTYRNYRMHIRESTHNISPYSIDHGMVGLDMPVLDVSSGRAYLAFCSETERSHLMAGLKEELKIVDPIILPEGPLDLLLDQTRELGVGFRRDNFRKGTCSMSSPIFHNDQIIACMTIIWTTSALKFDKAIDLYRDELVSVTRSISAAMAAQEGQDGQKAAG